MSRWLDMEDSGKAEEAPPSPGRKDDRSRWVNESPNLSNSPKRAHFKKRKTRSEEILRRKKKPVSEEVLMPMGMGSLDVKGIITQKLMLEEKRWQAAVQRDRDIKKWKREAAERSKSAGNLQSHKQNKVPSTGQREHEEEEEGRRKEEEEKTIEEQPHIQKAAEEKEEKRRQERERGERQRERRDRERERERRETERERRHREREGEREREREREI